MDKTPKKSTRAKKADNPTTPETTQAVIDKLREVADRFELALEEMNRQELKKLIVGGKPGLDTFFEKILAYLSNIWGLIKVPPSVLEEIKNSYRTLDELTSTKKTGEESTSTAKKTKDAARRTIKTPKNP